MSSFWNKLPKPFFTLAPLANVTDAAFRRIIAKYGKPDVMWTEFVSADGLYHTRDIKKIPDQDNPLMKDLIFTDKERPIVAQFFTSKPKMMERAAGLALELGFDGVDINMGCPDKSIEKQGAGASLCKNPELALSLIRAAKSGTKNKLPVSVKIRLGYNQDILESWLPELLKEEPVAVTIHARTRKEMSKVPAHWERIAKAVEIRNKLQSRSLIIGNGDVIDLEDAKRKALETGCDGIMLGKAIFGNPWLFANLAQIRSGCQIESSPKHCAKADIPDSENKLQILVEHTKLFDEILCNVKNFSVMKKHFKSYTVGLDQDRIKKIRSMLMEANNSNEVVDVIKKMIQKKK